MSRRLDGRDAGSGVFGPQVIPTGFGFAVGSSVVVASALVAATVPAAAWPARLGLVAVALAVFAASPVTAAAAAGTGGLAALVFDGFLVNSLGQLSWHGALDGWRLLTLAVAVVTGFVAGVACRAVIHRRRWRRLTLWIAAQPRETAGLYHRQPARAERLALHKE